jgi:hypothetical protein
MGICFSLECMERKNYVNFLIAAMKHTTTCTYIYAEDKSSAEMKVEEGDMR